MESNFQLYYQHQQLPNPHTTSGLLRFRSAPSSLLSNFTEGCVEPGANRGDFTKSSDSERLISGFMNYGGNGNSASLSFQQFEDKPPVMGATEAATNGASSQHSYSSGLPPHYPRYTTATTSSAMDGAYGLVGSIAVDRDVQTKADNSNLVRQSSSPAGLFSLTSIPNGYTSRKGVGNFDGVNDAGGDVSPSANRLKSQISFPSRLPASSLGMLSQISEIGTESVGANSPLDGKLGNGNDDLRFYGLGLPYGYWNDPSHLAEKFTAMKREQDDDGKLFSGTQNGGIGTQAQTLSHHLNLPKTSSDIVAMEKFLFQDSVPCKIRAKRGCATHPRSIAERVRRTRISERMRKLQELVPNMEKQTNTADMLDLAVDYIKDLQDQFKILSENRANCKCLSMQNPVSNQIA